MTTDRALACVDRAIDRATAELARLVLQVKVEEDAQGSGGGLISGVIESQIKVHAARAKVAALRDVWADIARLDRAGGEL